MEQNAFMHMYALFDLENPIRLPADRRVIKPPARTSESSSNGDSMTTSASTTATSLVSEIPGGSFERVRSKSLDAGPPGHGADTRLSKKEKKALYFEQKKQVLYKTELCRAFEETGECKFDTSCIFAHGQHELRDPSVPKHPRHKTEICKSFAETGTCSYGRRCCFLHIVQDSGESRLKGYGVQLEENDQEEWSFFGRATDHHLLDADNLSFNVDDFFRRQK